MKFVNFVGVAAMAMGFGAAAWAEGIVVEDAYARASTPTAKSGAAFMVLMNTSDQDDRLIGAKSDVAARVELHTHREIADGVMKMMEVEEGFVIPAGGSHMLARGGDHVMFMGLNEPFADGDTVAVTLVFEHAGEVAVEIPVDLNRKPTHGGGHGAGHGAGQGQ
ncbi:MAG: copper chaperone PCu(A)C [Rhodovulum sp.]|jgi:periplasmic copper chaperone A|nr:copper-binding protein [Rhodovulum sp.]MCI5085941.1 copper chaperone PCu(A)C [Rhodovulum sp.]|tara:strand:- start:273 stop:764 length:492 start_codon:yes stop_codon:yes gene_type:complete